jgi:prepilin peptidase CpaA
MSPSGPSASYRFITGGAGIRLALDDAGPTRDPFSTSEPRRAPGNHGVEPVSRPDLLPLAVVAVATLIASATDLWKFKVYNALTFPTLALGLAVSAALGGWSGLASSLLGAGLGLGLLVLFFAAGGVGAGDVKLLTAVGAWLGPYLTYQVFVASALLGGAYALALVFARGGVLGVAVELIAVRQALISPGSFKRPAPTIAAEVARPDRRRRLVPFAAMICLGFFATMAWWGSDLGRVWPPYDRPNTVATASNIDHGGAR